jgi:hypothetical protein
MPKWLVLRHEDLLAEPERCLDQIAKLVNISPPKQVEAIKSYKGYPFMGEFKPQTYAPFTEEEADFISGQSDAALESRLGYDVVENLRSATTRLDSAAAIAEFRESRHHHTERQLAEMRNYLLSIFAEYEKARAMVPQKSSKLRALWRSATARHFVPKSAPR